MKIEYDNNSVYLTDYNSFDIEEILESGQCFTFHKIDEKHYNYIAYRKLIHIKQNMEEGYVKFYPCTKEDFENIWYDYFDLGNDYDEIKNIISKDDNVLQEAIEFADGIRIMNQEFWDCLLGFIISQNNRITMIRQVINNLSKAYGCHLEGDFYSVPTALQLKDIEIDELREHKTGFRAKYIKDAVDRKNNGLLNEEELNSLDTKNAKKKLMEIYGVGTKVSDCVLTFSLGRREMFPVDVWVKRIMEYYYFDEKDTPTKVIHEFAESKWGDLAGYAQQYLFHFARLNKIGTK